MNRIILFRMFHVLYKIFRRSCGYTSVPLKRHRKSRWYNYNLCFDYRCSSCTTLYKHNLRRTDGVSEKSYKRGDYYSKLCLEERLCPLEYVENNLIKKRVELVFKCRHFNKFLLYHQPPGHIYSYDSFSPFFLNPTF